MVETTAVSGLEIAVIGMAGRFPGAENVAVFWENLKNGVESISFFGEEELRAVGVREDDLDDPAFVRANAVIDDIEYFDSTFFGYTPKEAEIMDPQMRLFHECVWTAVEDAGYDPASYQGLIGLYAGAAPHFNWEAYTILSGKIGEVGQFAGGQLARKDFLSVQVCYRLNLTGPGFTLYTSCSTSLVAIHLACQAILNGECDIGLAGGVTLARLSKTGYWFQEGMIASPDGHCRAFDSRTKGVVGGDGVGVVVLKRLPEAIKDRDHIYAVVKGSAINNDGIRKVGFSAPSVEGQVETIRMAQQAAGVDAESIGYIETHGTGTELGDPVEIEALKIAFIDNNRKFCALGSVKTNVGHLDCAAGVAGFIKTALALKHRFIPPSLHFENPNPKINFENSPFYVNTELKDWQNGRYPLRAGVSSFGIGGTNAHVILEEAQPANRSPENTILNPYRLILLSARTETALERMSANLARFLEKNPEIDLADAAYTLQVGRRSFKYRKMAVCSSVDEVSDALTGRESQPLSPAPAVFKYRVKKEKRSVVFMFSGQGSQYTNMGRDLYEREAVFRTAVERCFEILDELVDYNPGEVLYPGGDGKSPIDQTEMAQPLLFIVEYALARLLMRWGITPFAMIGHSIGEYVAACLAGVFTLKEALQVVALRGKLMQQVPAGAMLSLPMSEHDLLPLLAEGVSLAAVNGPSRCVVSGTPQAVDALAARLKAKGTEGRRLHTSHAFHSAMMEPILKEFEEGVGKIQLNKPQIPYISNLTGKWIKAGDVLNPAYWARHIRHTVRFGDGVEELLKEEGAVFVEVGPGQALSTLVSQHPNRQGDHYILNLIRHPQEEIPDIKYLLTRLGQLWLRALKIDWPEFHARENRYRISLPTYSFDRHRYSLGRDPYELAAELLRLQVKVPPKRKPDVADWFYVPNWQQSDLADGQPGEAAGYRHWLVFVDRQEIGRQLVEQLRLDSRHVTVVRPGTGFVRTDEQEYTVRPAEAGDYDSLFAELKRLNSVPQKIVHCWRVTADPAGETGLEELDQLQALGIHSLLAIARSIGRQKIRSKIALEVVTNGMQRVCADDRVCPEKATLLGPVKIIPVEYQNISCRSLDIGLSEDPAPLLWEFATDPPEGDILIAYRRGQRWRQAYQPKRLEKPEGLGRRFRERGVYLIIGGFGGMGFTLAGHLARFYKARLILTGRSPFPPRSQWQSWLNAHDEAEVTASRIRQIRAFEQQGAEVLVFGVDAADLEQMQAVIAESQKRFGPINGVIHTAGVVDYGGVIQRRTREITDQYMASKVKGTMIVDRLLGDTKLDFLALFSSAGNVMYREKFGQVSYNAANEFLEAFADSKAGDNGREDGTYTVAINWCDWLQVGMTINAIREQEGDLDKINFDLRLPGAITPAEGAEVFSRIMAYNLPRVTISTFDLRQSLKSQENENRRNRGARVQAEEPAAAAALKERPELNSEYAAPGSETEAALVKVWEKFLGYGGIGIDDNFFELGGDSLKALAILPQLEKGLNADVSLSDVLLYPTIRELAANIREEEAETFAGLACIVRLNKGQNKKNIFFLHAMHGMVYQYKDLARLLEDHVNIYGVQARGLMRKSWLPETRDIMMAEYLWQIRQVQPEGPYIIAGYCFGDMLAYNMVKLLEDMGCEVERLIMFDEPAFIPPKVLYYYRRRERMRNILNFFSAFWGKKDGQNPAVAVHEALVAEIRKRDDACQDEPPRSPEQSEILKKKVDENNQKLDRAYWDGSSYRQLTGIIKAPILDIQAKDSHMKVYKAGVSLMTYGGVTVEVSDGDHDNLFEMPHVEKLAAILGKI